MKTIFFRIIILIQIYLLLPHFNNQVFGSNVEPLYSSFKLDLKSVFSKNELTDLNLKIYYAVKVGIIKAYKNDSLTSFLSKEEVLKIGIYEKMIEILDPNDPTKKNFIDSNIIVPFDPKDILSTYRVSYKIIYDYNNDFSLEFTGLSLQFSWYNYININLYFVSMADLKKLFGSEKTTDLFSGCYKAFYNAINFDSTTKSDFLASFSFRVDEYLGSTFRYDINRKMVISAFQLSSDTQISYHVYKTYKLDTTYAFEDFIYLELIIKDTGESIESFESEKKWDWGERANYYSVAFRWSYYPEKMLATMDISAFSFNIVYYYRGKIIDTDKYFWFNWNDALKVYSPVEITILKYTFYKAFAVFLDNVGRS